METWEWVVVAAAIAFIVLAVGLLVAIRSRRNRLKSQFGSEYDRTVSGSGVAAGERRLADLRREHSDLEITELSTAACERYRDEWRQAETRFVSDPQDATRAGRRIVERALEERGYPGDRDVDGRVGLIAVDHPDASDRYRHGVAMMDGNGAPDTENLRKAMLDFRATLDELVQGSRAA